MMARYMDRVIFVFWKLLSVIWDTLWKAVKANYDTKEKVNILPITPAILVGMALEKVNVLLFY